MLLFSKIFNKLLHEDMTSGGGDVFGSGSSSGQGGATSNSDFYAKGDHRIPSFLGGKKTRKRRKISKKAKKDKKKIDMTTSQAFPAAQTRMSGMSGPGGKSGFSGF